ncbi:MAG: S1C family serine protease [Oscillospiraceae bacterium]|jgi:serine protease Do|nr:S1C family serine protease [Oscillospiraceae bacterium]
MDNFLKNNHDVYYHTAGAENTENRKLKPKKKKNRSAAAIAACLLVMILGISGGAGGTFLAAYFMDAIFEDGGTQTRPQIPLISNNQTSREPAENFHLITSDTLVINNNTTPFAPVELFEVVRDGVVGIEVSYRPSGRSGRSDEFQLVGSGFVFTTDGYVLTNSHVIENAERVNVLVDDYENHDIIHRYEAEVIGLDDKTDLAVLKITREEEFKALPIGESSSLRVGTFVSPIGFPLGLEKSMTHGIVSGLNREFAGGGHELSSIQFDAAVNNGNSGGPLLDMYGSVVGIVNKKLIFENYVDNIGLAITIDEAKPIINDLLLHGRVMTRPMLGITPIALNEFNAAMYGINVTSGILVTSINHMAPAFHSELSVGDVIVEINGIPVESVTDVQSQIKNNRPGDIIELTVIRFNESGNQRRVTVELELANEAELIWE